MTGEKLSENQPKWCEWISDCSLVKALEAEVKRLTETVDFLRGTIRAQSDIIMKRNIRAESAEAEVKTLTEEHEKDGIIIGELQSNETRLFNELKETTEALDDSVPQVAFDRLNDRLAKAQEHIKVTEKFVRDEDWSDYLSALEEKGLGGE